MECDDAENSGGVSNPEVESRSAVNSTILNYYKKFGRKRDLEQYFSLSTATSDVKDPTSLFWRKMKSQDDSSDSGDNKESESSKELCRISIKCYPQASTSSSQDDKSKSKTTSESPPIITEEIEGQVVSTTKDTSRNSDDESVRSDDNQSQRSIDGALDSSINKPFSPTSSITSQRKLEWDSLADVGYGNDDRKTSSSGLSTLERLALQQQYSNNDTKLDCNMGLPTAHSTPLDDESKSKSKKGSKVTKFYGKDTDLVEVNLPHNLEAKPTPSINVNLTKHISFNVDNDGGVKIDRVKKDVFVQPDKVSVETEMTPQVKSDKEIQTSLSRTNDNANIPNSVQLYGQSVPVLINLNNLRKKNRRKKPRSPKKKPRGRKKSEAEKENNPIHEKSGDQVSEAESFEYMPGHMYNQNHMPDAQTSHSRTRGAVDNKSSLESSGAHTTTDSSKSKASFSKDLEKSITLLKATVQKRYNDAALKQKLIKGIVQSLLKSHYKDDESSTDFLSGLSYNSKKLGLTGSHTTTSTSEANNSEEKGKLPRPKKSILRVAKGNSKVVASTSQSTPNLPAVAKSEKLVNSVHTRSLTSSNTESDVSSKDRNSSDNLLAKTSSEKLYEKYLEALKREETYKKHLIDKEIFLKQKLASSDNNLNMPMRLNPQSQNRIKELMKDLTRNNYDDGSGDASKLEGGSSSNNDRYAVRSQRSHSVFTLSSGNSDLRGQKDNPQSNENKSPRAGHGKDHYCCCPYHFNLRVTNCDSSVQVNLNEENEEEKAQKLTKLKSLCCKAHSPDKLTQLISDNVKGDIKYVCLCNKDTIDANKHDNLHIYKCMRLNENKMSLSLPDSMSCQPSTSKLTHRNICVVEDSDGTSVKGKTSKTSQTSLGFHQLPPETKIVHEATRCIQTEICINPRISDPVFTDIKYICPKDCVTLICERYRQVSKSSFQTGTTNLPIYTSNDEAQNVELNTPSEFSYGTSTSGGRAKRYGLNNYDSQSAILKVDKGVQPDSVDECVGIKSTTPLETVNDNFTIPIQGTNMTLLVSIGSVKQVPVTGSINNVQRSRAIETDPIKTAETFTSLIEECSKGVQSQNVDIFTTKEPPQLNTLFRRQENMHARSINTDNVFSKQQEDMNECVQNNNTENTVFRRQETFDTEKVKSSESQTDIAQGCDLKKAIGQYNTYPSPDCSTKPTFSSLPNKPRCPCPDSAQCKGTCGKDSECMKFTAVTGDLSAKEVLRDRWQQKQTFSYENDAVKLSQRKESCLHEKIGISSADTANLSPRQHLKDSHNNTQKIYIEADTANLSSRRESCTREKMRCPCPDSSKCDGKCDEGAACCIQKPTLRSEDDDKAPVDADDLSPANLSLRKDLGECLPEEGVTGIQQNQILESAAEPSGFSSKNDRCLEGKEMSDSGTNTDNFSQLRDCQPSNNQKCVCPGSKKCGGICDENAACVKECKNVSDKRNIGVYRSDAENNRKMSIKSTRRDIFSPRKVREEVEHKYLKQSIHSRGGSKNSSPRRCLKSEQRKCACPPSSKCGGTCAPDADCTRRKKQSTDEEQSETSAKPGTSSDENRGKKSGDDSCINHKDLVESGFSKDIVMDMIQEITRKYSKKDIERSQRKKCFREIMAILNYLLDTDDNEPVNVKNNRKPERQINMMTTTTTDDDYDSRTQSTRNQNATDDKESSDCKPSQNKLTEKTTEENVSSQDQPKGSSGQKEMVDKGVQLCSKKPKYKTTESSELPVTSEFPTSSDSTTCKVWNRIRKECEKYHHKRCKCHKKIETTTSSSVDCEQCRRVHYCLCRAYKCKHRTKSSLEKLKKKCVAYNLIIQTSESFTSEETTCNRNSRQMKNIVIKVPNKYKQDPNVPFKELSNKIENQKPCYSPKSDHNHRSRSAPKYTCTNAGDYPGKPEICTVREYLERNRPDFVEQCNKRQNCLKLINDARNQDCTSPQLKMVVIHNSNCNECVDPCQMYCGGGVKMACQPSPNTYYCKPCVPNEVTGLVYERLAQRELLSLQLQLDNEPALGLDASELRRLANLFRDDLRRRKQSSKFISEREMKKHSEKIYKSLPEVQRKKEEIRKENIKKTNLLMATIFKKVVRSRWMQAVRDRPLGPVMESPMFSSGCFPEESPKESPQRRSHNFKLQPNSQDMTI